MSSEFVAIYLRKITKHAAKAFIITALLMIKQFLSTEDLRAIFTRQILYSHDFFYV